MSSLFYIFFFFYLNGYPRKLHVPTTPFPPRPSSCLLGLMRATDQIESLSLMAIDPVAKTVVPRFWAAIIGMPLLCGFFCSFAIVAGYLEAVYVLGLDPGYFWSALKASVDLVGD